MKLIVAGLLTLVLSYLSVTTQAQVYGGLSVGNAFLEKTLSDDASDYTLDKNSLTYRVFAGLGGKLIGVEGGYRDLGKAKDSPDLETKITGWDLAARGRLAIGPVLGFVKAGAFFSHAENKINSYGYQEDTTSFLWGFGGGFKLGIIGFRLEYENLDMREKSKISVLSFGITAHLGGK